MNVFFVRLLVLFFHGMTLRKNDFFIVTHQKYRNSIGNFPIKIKTGEFLVEQRKMRVHYGRIWIETRLR